MSSLVVFTLVVSASASPPHLIQLVIDDFGWSDHSIFSHPAQPADIPTPTLKDLAGAGVLLTNYYVQPVCSPTRSALMTAPLALMAASFALMVVRLWRRLARLSRPWSHSSRT